MSDKNLDRCKQILECAGHIQSFSAVDEVDEGAGSAAFTKKAAEARAAISRAERRLDDPQKAMQNLRTAGAAVEVLMHIVQGN